MQMIGPQIKPGEGLNLPPRLFRSLIDPYKSNAFAARNRQFVDFLEYQQLSLRPRCVGHFWDNEKMRAVNVDLGEVTIRTVFAYRAAPSGVTEGSFPLLQGGAAKPFEGEGAAQYADFAAEYRPQASAEDGTEAAGFSPGPYVIPGQVATDCQNHQKTGGQVATDGCYEWTLEKCAEEIC